ncbi:MAG: hypothetical protein KUL85_10035 [Sphingobacterium mizutaii]|nr:hypothetical protein [Sphingobacterium mizutaii]
MASTYHGVFKPSYKDIYVSLYLDIIHSYLKKYGHIAHHLSSHPIGHICNRQLGPPIRPLTDLNYPFQDHRPYYGPILSPPSEQRRQGDRISRLPLWRAGAVDRLATLVLPSHRP